jgi:hypothetical protein
MLTSPHVDLHVFGFGHECDEAPRCSPWIAEKATEIIREINIVEFSRRSLSVYFVFIARPQYSRACLQLPSYAHLGP